MSAGHTNRPIRIFDGTMRRTATRQPSQMFLPANGKSQWEVTVANNKANNNRSRGRGRKPGGGGGNNANRSYESNGPDVKIRGNASHISEKYQQLARDAAASGDRVGAENYLQHAEHYYRMVLETQQQTQQQREQREQRAAAEAEANGNGGGNGDGASADGSAEKSDGGREGGNRRRGRRRRDTVQEKTEAGADNDASDTDADGNRDDADAGNDADDASPNEAEVIKLTPAPAPEGDTDDAVSEPA